MRCEVCGSQHGKLLTAKELQVEYGLGRAAAEQLMRHVPKVVVPGLRRVYVRREMVERRLAEWSVL